MDPAWDVAIMSNLDPSKKSGDPRVDLTLDMFWYSGENKVQAWRSGRDGAARRARAWGLSTNMRSGEDERLSTVLNECREGKLSEANYNFFHGLPTTAPIGFWYHRRKESREWHAERACGWGRERSDCTQGQKRRNRWLNVEADPLSAAEKLADDRFKKCVLITPFNKAVLQRSIHRARTSASAKREQLFWMQAVDKPPAWFAGTRGVEEIERMQRKWLQYHARKTEGILSLCPRCHGMPMRIASGNSGLCREYGVHNGAACTAAGWALEASDKEALENCPEAQVVLRSLPKKHIVHMDRPLPKAYPGLPENCFPLSPATVYRTLDVEESIEIARRGFPAVPNFSTTIDGATGVSVMPSFTRAMKGCVALSRVTKADDMYLTQPFSPTLFQQGPRPWPTLLLDVARGGRRD